MAKPVGEGKTFWQWKSGMEKSPRPSITPLMVGDRMAGRPYAEIRETKPGETVFMLED
jgi:hypothetical protein